ncbi:pilus (MSHA type) biogenesis protein MshL [Campylobacter insulaenigrae]|uniref:Pilus (MSHA type) biogenesis protein MshL n=1 Tax=Campylobacter insulaenigrae TaxID=260714 RepID=A0ABY3G5D0_9BACT|nr:pilus (MSHA type) biogenesis protein MshL [Campylobacter insulaenigrae]MCR6572099.1 pilus (MSHA type) biogenesis protein MshL [Campylobacter insulaenigrae]MCR6576764.1 pilus (MSHA type) biogenesis protein MshL [Campylobacter insulaenigrae]MCR6581024.1 pilus (MSHA type) biogenesis protein MshL [Campylobacter insulaenigrae]MCR6587947.1 pilus (MSHA type) biogenesis protein MshL [Campylobacter insulaenigrae]TWO26105.1 pilus (MSHA type) biogenesis protein MshL [Campylobacter insulaenigrae]
MKKIIILLFISLCSVNIFANSCYKRVFDISIDSKGTLLEILNELGKECGFSVVIKDELARNKLNIDQNYLHIRKMSLREIFDLLLKENNLAYEYEKNILKIYGTIIKTFKVHYISSIREGQSITKASVDSRPRQGEYDHSNKEADNLVISTDKFDFWANITEEIQALLDENTAKPIVNTNAGIITLKATPYEITRIQNYLDDLNKRLKKQVLIEVSIVAVHLNKSHSNGINWQEFAFRLNGDDNNFVINKGGIKNINLKANVDTKAILNLLQENGKTIVLSNPKLTALNNQQAIISIGDTINYQVKESSKGTENGTTISETYNNYSIFVGILLNILPEISDDHKIMLRINPSLSDLKYSVDNHHQNKPRNIAPDTIQKKLSTVVEVEDSQTLILGGLISKNSLNNQNEINILSKIPIFGLLFQGKQNIEDTSEIVFIIKPTIIHENKKILNLKELGFENENYMF